MNVKEYVKRIAAAAIAILSVSVPAIASDSQAERQRLFWPDIMLATNNGERIRAIEVRMSCGRFRGIGNIPNDWSIEVVSPSSEQTRLSASSGHGSTAIWSIKELDGSIQFIVNEPTCFDISATVTIQTSGSDRMITFKRSELRAKP